MVTASHTILFECVCSYATRKKENQEHWRMSLENKLKKAYKLHIHNTSHHICAPLSTPFTPVFAKAFIIPFPFICDGFACLAWLVGFL